MSIISQKTSNLLSDSAIHTATLNAVGSKCFLRRLIPAAIASILYRRTNFDRNAFDLHNRNGIEYAIFNTNSQNYALRKLLYWIKGIIHALDRNYLRELYFIFTKVNEPTEVIESYKFKLKKLGDNDTFVVTKKDLTQSTNFLLKSIYELYSFDLLQSNEFAPFFILTYYNDVTPKDYEPPFFNDRDATAAALLHNISKGDKNFAYFGKIVTGFHTLKCRSKIILPPLDSSSNCTSTTKTVNTSKTLIHEEARTSTNISSESRRDSQSSFTDNDTSTNVYKFRCPCGLNIEFDKVEVVKCSICWSLHHAPCLRHLYAATVPADFTCDQCNNLSPLSSRKTYLYQIKSIYWLAIAYAYFNNVVPFEILSHVDPRFKEFVLQKLQSLQVVKLEGSEYVLDMAQLEKVILEKIFLKPDETNVILPDSNKLENVKDDDENSILLSIPTKKQKLN